jgi:hypothetical protein
MSVRLSISPETRQLDDDYPHVLDLDALLLELVRRLLADLKVAVRAAVTAGGGPGEALRSAAVAYVYWGLERPGPGLPVAAVRGADRRRRPPFV